MKVAASPRIYIGRCPKVSERAGFPFQISYHRPFDRERKRFLATLEMTIRERQMSQSLPLSQSLSLSVS